MGGAFVWGFSVVLLIACASAGFGGTWDALGPTDVVRATGWPNTVTASFTILNPKTTYTLRINSRNTLYLKSATLNNENVLDGPFAISNGGNLEIVMSGNAAEVLLSRRWIVLIFTLDI